MALGIYEQDVVHPLNPDMVGNMSSDKPFDGSQAPWLMHACILLCMTAEEDA